MKKIIILFTLLTSVTIFGQSKSETEDWIVEKHNEYKRSINPYMDLWFEDGYLFYYWTVDDRSSAEKRIAVIYKLKVKDIKAVRTKIKQLDNSSMSIFTIYCNKGKITSKSLPNESNFVNTGEDFLNISLNQDFKTEGLNIRMEKAFLHLVKLNGGAATIKKEAF